MIKSTYLGEVLYFETLEEAINYYYSFKDTVIEDLWDLQEFLKEEMNGMAYPELEELD